MKSFITFLFALLLSVSTFAKSILLPPMMLTSKPSIDLEIVTEIDEQGNTIYTIIGYVALSAIPTTIKQLCVMTGYKEEVCNGVKDMLSDFISLSTASNTLRKGGNQLFQWVVSKSKQLGRGKILLTTGSFGVAQALRTLLQAYKDDGCLKFSSIEASKKSPLPLPNVKKSAEDITSCTGKATIIKNGVRVRQYPILYTRSTNIITHLNKNTKVSILQRTKKKLFVEGWGENYWYQIQTKNGTKGWVFGGLLKL